MSEIMKLYYYEVLKNKNKFILILFCILFFNIILIANISIPLFGNMTISATKKIAEIFLNNNTVRDIFKESIVNSMYNGINFHTLGIDMLIIAFYYLGSLTCVLLSFDVVFRNYKKKNNSSIIDALLPVKLVNIKIARVMYGISIYMFFIVITTLSILIINFVLGVIYPKLYNSNLYFMTTFEGNTFFPDNISRTLILNFIFILTSVICVQSLTSTLFVAHKKGDIIKKVLCFTLLLIACIILGFLILLTEPSLSTIFDNKHMYLIYLILIFTSIILFYIDCRVSKRRLRGGY